MSFKHVASQTMRGLRVGFTSLLLLQFSLGGFLVSPVQAPRTPPRQYPHTDQTRHCDHR